MRVAALLFVIIFLASGCNSHVHISEIKYEPQKYQDKQVSVRGRVVETLSIPFVQKGMYQVDDGTGRIWVMSQKRVPFRGDEVTVKGEVKTGFTIRDQTFGTIIVEGGEDR